MPETGVYRFGVFELDSHARELKKHGVRIKLQDQPLRILLLLLQHPGEVVTREQIQSELWAAGTYVDYENAINSSVRKLREALGDTPANPRFIETLSRRGYRLLVPVSRDGAADPRIEVEAPVQSVPSRTTRRFRWHVVGAGGVLLIAAVAVLLLRQRASVSEGQLPPAVPLTSYPGQIAFPSFSPDGTRVAFAWDGPKRDNLDVYVKLIGAGEPVRLTTDSAVDTSPAWSPHGGWIAFQRVGEQGDTAVVVMPAMGGPERVVTHLGSIAFSLIGDSWLSWSADERSLFAVDGGTGPKGIWITQISVESGDKAAVTFPAAPSRDGAPAVSPDGTKLAFTRDAGFALQDIFVVSLLESKDRPPRRITWDAKAIESIAWTGDGRQLVFSSARGGGNALWQVAADGRSRPVPLTGGAENSHHVAISPQGRLIYASATSNSHLWRLPVGRDRSAAAPFVATTRQDFFPQYSQDGKRITFESTRSGKHEIWTCNEDGSALTQLTSMGAWSGTPRWSPAGDRIVFDSNGSGNWDIYAIDARGGKSVQVTTNRAADVVPSWSRDGKWIYFSSARTGRNEIWKMPTAGGQEVQVTRNGGWGAFEAAGSRELYFTKNERLSGLYRMTLPDGAEEELVGPLRGRNFVAAAGGVYLIQGFGSAATLRFLDYHSRSIKDVAPLLGPVGSGMAISPDEKVLLYSRDEAANAELMLVEGFGRKSVP